MSSRRMGPAIARGLAAVCVLGIAIPAMAQGGAARRPRIFVDVSAGVSGLAHGFSQAADVPVNGESESLRADYGARQAALIDIGGGVSLGRQFRVQASFTRAARRADARVSAEVPHPLFFNQLRSIEGVASGLSHTESAIHIDLMWRLPLSGLDVHLFAGPTIVSVRQELVSGVTYSETYPYDTAAFAGAPADTRSKSAAGVNAGVDVAAYFTRTLGVGAIVRASSVRPALDSPLGGRVRMKAGGLEVGGGLRLRF